MVYGSSNEHSDLRQHEHQLKSNTYPSFAANGYVGQRTAVLSQAFTGATTSGAQYDATARTGSHSAENIDFGPEFNPHNEKIEPMPVHKFNQYDDRWEAQPYQPEELDFGVGLPPIA